MGTAQTTITGNSANITLQLDEAGPSESTSPPPEMVEVTQKRAIAIHPIPARDGDRAQDMGAFSTKVRVTGIGQLDVKNGLKDLAERSQLDSNGYGMVTVTMKNAAGTTLETYSNLALDDYSRTALKGRPKWFNYVINFTQYKA